MERDYRVGCFDATFEQETVQIQHDSMDEPLKLDYEEIHDLYDILSLLQLRHKVDNDIEGAEGQLKMLKENLEA